MRLSGQMGEVWEPSTKQTCHRNRVLITVLGLKGYHTLLHFWDDDFMPPLTATLPDVHPIPKNLHQQENACHMCKSSRGKIKWNKTSQPIHMDINFSNKRAVLHAICCQNIIKSLASAWCVLWGLLKYRIRQHVVMNTTRSDHVLPLR
jgi:hypothetical protein